MLIMNRNFWEVALNSQITNIELWCQKCPHTYKNKLILKVEKKERANPW